MMEELCSKIHIETDSSRRKSQNWAHNQDLTNSDYVYWQGQDKKTLKGINILIKETMRLPAELQAVAGIAFVFRGIKETRAT